MSIATPNAFLMQTLFITGAGTEVGKTYVTALIAQQLRQEGHRVGVYKPVASDCPNGRSDDAQRLWQAAGRPLTPQAVCPLRFAAPLAPHVAARLEGRSYTPEQLVAGAEIWLSECDILLIEGAGGLMSPLAEGDFYNADLADAFESPMVTVVPNRLGVIHDTLAVLLAADARCRRASTRGVVLNAVTPEPDVSCASNAQEIAARAPVPLLATVAHSGGFDRSVHWLALLDPTR